MPILMVELVHQHESRLRCALPGSGKPSVRILRPTSHCACPRCGPIVQGVQGGTRTISSEALVDGDENTSGEMLLQQSVQALDEAWRIGAMLGDNLRLSTKDGTEEPSTGVGVLYVGF